MYKNPWIGPTICTTAGRPAAYCSGIPTHTRTSRKIPTT